MDWLFGRASASGTKRSSISSGSAAQEETLPLATSYQAPVETQVVVSTGTGVSSDHAISKQRQQQQQQQGPGLSGGGGDNTNSLSSSSSDVRVFITPSAPQHDKPPLPQTAAGAGAGAVNRRASDPTASSKGLRGSSSSSSSAASWKAAAFGVTNLASVVMIVFANKLVLYTHGFGFAVTLTWLHTVFTAFGMMLMAAAGVFEVKRVPKAKALPVAAVFCMSIVFNNLSIKLNSVSLYQISKIAITPVIVAIEFLCFSKSPSARVMASIVVLLTGIALATVTDSQVASNPLGMLVAAVNVVVTGLYQVWAGSKQKELGLNGLQLLHQVSPLAAGLLLVLIPFLEPVGYPSNPGPGTILGFHLTPLAALWIVISSALGLVVTLSTFMFISATSSLTYNVVGHLKTIMIVTGGVLIFGDSMALKKFAGLCIAMAGIMWYSQIKMSEAEKQAAAQKK